jgi:carboxyl-terminal processing protease
MTRPRAARATPCSRLRAIGKWLCVTVFIFAPAIVVAQAPPILPAAPQIGDSALFAATFDSAWARIDRSYYDSTMRGLDWEVLRDTLLPQAAAAASTAELRGVIARMLESLGESHFALIPAEAAQVLATDPEAGEDGDAGLDLRMVDNELLVSRIDSAGPAWNAGVRAGWRLLSIDGERVADLIDHLRAALGDRGASLATIHGPRVAESRFVGRAGRRVTAEFSDAGGRVVQVRMVRRVARGQAVNFGYLPTIHAIVEHRRLERAGRCVGVVRLSAWMPPVAAALDSAIVAYNRCTGIVLDLRGNPGGLAGMVMGVAGHFLPRPDSLGTLRLRGATLHLVANPRYVDAGSNPVEPFGGRLAILVDELSASTSEIFAGALQMLRRARVFGVRSLGYALPAQISRLPNGDLLMHVVADFTLPGGTRVEGRGSRPRCGSSAVEGNVA